MPVLLRAVYHRVIMKRRNSQSLPETAPVVDAPKAGVSGVGDSDHKARSTAADGLPERVLHRLCQVGIGKGDHLLVAVSGGADSVALLRVLHALRPRLGMALTVMHLHHGLRPPEEADGDAAFVEALSLSLDIPCRTVRISVREAARESGQSLEEAARELRRRALLSHRVAHGMRWALLAHHLDDQAETVLLRLLRGSGTLGLGGMEAETPDGFLRPLLSERRETLRAYLRSIGQAWREDSTNRDPFAERNRIRAEVLPLLESVRPGAAVRIAEAAHVLREDARLIEGIANRWLVPESDPNAGPWVMVPQEAWRRAPESLRREWIRSAARLLGLSMPTLAFTEAWSTWPEVRRPRPDSPFLRLGCDARGVYLFARLDAPGGAPKPVQPLVPEEDSACRGLPAYAPEAALRIGDPRACTRPEDSFHAHVCLAGARLLGIRPARNGDRLAVAVGGVGTRLSNLLRRRLVPGPLKNRIWVVVRRDSDRILWVPGHTLLSAATRGNRMAGSNTVAYSAMSANHTEGTKDTIHTTQARGTEDDESSSLPEGRRGVPDSFGDPELTDLCLVWIAPAPVSFPVTPEGASLDALVELLLRL